MSDNPSAGRWFKSSRSAYGPACVEVRIDPSEVRVRDSKDPGPELRLTRDQWRGLIAFVRTE